MNEHVRVVEVGPRDGLQNEQAIVPTAIKIELIERLAACGYDTVEATSFVSPKWIPQLADAEAVMHGLRRRPGVRYPVLVPNLQGYACARRRCPRSRCSPQPPKPSTARTSTPRSMNPSRASSRC
ncbi:hydroxymethylglutaryl-CoA lyase [mine drainage metagenome]|uniref:Hydroxymethylglutaryl-CoA lyase n=1 Tax=mine drainage metagenome TaxID=410659 RepID=T1BIH3_9ZZZZ